jgi:phage gp36-like protein
VAAYATYTKFASAVRADALLEFADGDNDGVMGADDIAWVESYLLKASQLVDSYCTAYLPFESAQADGIIHDVTVDVAHGLMRMKRNKTTEDSRRDYDARMEWLKMVSTGKVVLTPDAADDPGEPVADARCQQWGRNLNGGFF